MQLNTKDAAAGTMFIGIGLFFAGYAYFNLRLGSLGAMGPGFFPAVLGSLLILLGTGVVAKSTGVRSSPIGRTSLRGIAMVTLAIIFFGFAVRTLGLVPALAGSTALAASASNRSTFRGAVLLTVGMTVFCTALFVYALGLPIPTIGPWLRGY